MVKKNVKAASKPASSKGGSSKPGKSGRVKTVAKKAAPAAKTKPTARKLSAASKSSASVKTKSAGKVAGQTKTAGKKTVSTSAKSAPAPKRAASTSKAKVATRAAASTTKSVPKSDVSEKAVSLKPPVKATNVRKKMKSRKKIADIVLPDGYRPSEDEPFMSDLHQAYFRRRLLDWKDEILRQTRETLAILHEDSTQHADIADRATSETDRATELRTRDRQRKLVSKIDAAVSRIDDGSYGYCEETGEPIGVRRLDARPIATLSVEAQERHERRERVYREE